MPRLVFTHAAQTNLTEIADYIESTSGNTAVAERFCDELIAKLPGLLGRARPELLPDLRSMPDGNYLIFFRYVDDTFEVVGILEGHRDIADYFETDP